jgi:hypothetical protein
MRIYEPPLQSAGSAMLHAGHARTFAISPRQEPCLIASLLSSTSHSQEKSEDCKHAQHQEVIAVGAGVQGLSNLVAMSVSGSLNCMSKSDVSDLSGEFVLLKKTLHHAERGKIFFCFCAVPHARCCQYAVHMIGMLHLCASSSVYW